jgi:hypothetical protein
MPRIHRLKQHIRLALVILILFVLISGCTPDQGIIAFESTAISPTQESTPVLQAEVSFRVQIPLNTPEDRPVFLEIVDEVTGLGLNPMRYRMENKSPNHYSIRLPIVIGSVVQYRYVLGGERLAIEYTPSGSQVRYRAYPVHGPGLIQDIVAGWSGQPYTGDTGRIFGTVSDQDGKPVPDILVTAGGAQTISAADGSFLLDHLPLGTHHLTAFSIHGDYAPYEQGASVEAGSATFAQLQITAADTVNVAFMVDVPKLPSENAQVRLLGNLYALGNTYGNMGGGISTIASRAPVLAKFQDGKYGITLELPVGFDLRYKYSLGDGFWNAEHADDKFLVRQLIVPSQDVIIYDNVETWASGSSAPLVLTVQTPEDTPPDDTISIQFNPFTWMEPVPMWRVDKYEWTYTISSPIELLGEVEYRYCRNDQCASEDAMTGGSTAKYVFSSSSQIQYFQDRVDQWPDWTPKKHTTTVPSTTIDPRSQPFWAGVEYSPRYHPGWMSYHNYALNGVSALNGNLLVLTPTWTYTQQNPPILTAIPGKDGLWIDWVNMAKNARNAGIPTAVYPIPTASSGLIEWWGSAERDLSWWYSWYDRYQTFLLHYAEYAHQVGAEALIIGGPEVTPSFPNGQLPDGSPSGTPDEAESRWREIIAEVRKRYDGPLMLALPYDGEMVSPPPFLQEFDQIYLLWQAPLTDENNASYKDLASAFGELLDRDVRSLRKNSRKPVVLALSYPSIDGAMQGCKFSDTNCYSSGSTKIDLQEQVDLYNAALTAMNTRDWIDGFVSRGYFAPAVLQDGSTTVHGKPAWDVLWYWYPRLLQTSQTAEN